MSRNKKNSSLFTDNEHQKAYPIAKATTLLRDDVTNKGLLKNPYNTKNEAVPSGGVLARPLRITTDTFGNVFAKSDTILISGVTNINMLQNPDRNHVEIAPTQRTLSRQMVKDLNNGKLPKFITQNKGVSEISYKLIMTMPNIGAKLITIEIIRSLITNKRFNVKDYGGQHASKAISYFEQMINDATKAHRAGMLDVIIKTIIDKYVNSIESVFGATIRQAVPDEEIATGMQNLAEISGVLIRLFNEQNRLEPTNNMTFEQIMGLPPSINSLIPNASSPNAFFFEGRQDNQPSPPQGIHDPDVIQDPTNDIRPDQPDSNMAHSVSGQAVQHVTQQQPINNPPEGKSNILRNALIAGGITAGLAGALYLFGMSIHGAADQLFRNPAGLIGRIPPRLPRPPPPGAPAPAPPVAPAPAPVGGLAPVGASPAPLIGAVPQMADALAGGMPGYEAAQEQKHAVDDAVGQLVVRQNAPSALDMAGSMAQAVMDPRTSYEALGEQKLLENVKQERELLLNMLDREASGFVQRNRADRQRFIDESERRLKELTDERANLLSARSARLARRVEAEAQLPPPEMPIVNEWAKVPSTGFYSRRDVAKSLELQTRLPFTQLPERVITDLWDVARKYSDAMKTIGDPGKSNTNLDNKNSFVVAAIYDVFIKRKLFNIDDYVGKNFGGLLTASESQPTHPRSQIEEGIGVVTRLQNEGEAERRIVPTELAPARRPPRESPIVEVKAEDELPFGNDLSSMNQSEYNRVVWLVRDKVVRDLMADPKYQKFPYNTSGYADTINDIIGRRFIDNTEWTLEELNEEIRNEFIDIDNVDEYKRIHGRKKVQSEESKKRAIRMEGERKKLEVVARRESEQLYKPVIASIHQYADLVKKRKEYTRSVLPNLIQEFEETAYTKASQLEIERANELEAIIEETKKLTEAKNQLVSQSTRRDLERKEASRQFMGSMLYNIRHEEEERDLERKEASRQFMGSMLHNIRREEAEQIEEEAQRRVKERKRLPPINKWALTPSTGFFNKNIVAEELNIHPDDVTKIWNVARKYTILPDPSSITGGDDMRNIALKVVNVIHDVFSDRKLFDMNDYIEKDPIVLEERRQNDIRLKRIAEEARQETLAREERRKARELAKAEETEKYRALLKKEKAQQNLPEQSTTLQSRLQHSEALPAEGVTAEEVSQRVRSQVEEGQGVLTRLQAEQEAVHQVEETKAEAQPPIYDLSNMNQGEQYNLVHRIMHENPLHHQDDISDLTKKQKKAIIRKAMARAVEVMHIMPKHQGWPYGTPLFREKIEEALQVFLESVDNEYFRNSLGDIELTAVQFVDDAKREAVKQANRDGTNPNSTAMKPSISRRANKPTPTLTVESTVATIPEDVVPQQPRRKGQLKKLGKQVVTMQNITNALSKAAKRHSSAKDERARLLKEAEDFFLERPWDKEWMARKEGLQTAERYKNILNEYTDEKLRDLEGAAEYFEESEKRRHAELRPIKWLLSDTKIEHQLAVRDLELAKLMKGLIYTKKELEELNVPSEIQGVFGAARELANQEKDENAPKNEHELARSTESTRQLIELYRTADFKKVAQIVNDRRVLRKPIMADDAKQLWLIAITSSTLDINDVGDNPEEYIANAICDNLEDIREDIAQKPRPDLPNEAFFFDEDPQPIDIPVDKPIEVPIESSLESSVPSKKPKRQRKKKEQVAPEEPEEKQEGNVPVPNRRDKEATWIYEASYRDGRSSTPPPIYMGNYDWKKILATLYDGVIQENEERLARRDSTKIYKKGTYMHALFKLYKQIIQDLQGQLPDRVTFNRIGTKDIDPRKEERPETYNMLQGVKSLRYTDLQKYMQVMTFAIEKYQRDHNIPQAGRGMKRHTSSNAPKTKKASKKEMDDIDARIMAILKK